jgi:hypothetical protein
MRGLGVFAIVSAFARFRRDGDRLSVVGSLIPICCALFDRRNRAADGIEFKLLTLSTYRPYDDPALAGI